MLDIVDAEAGGDIGRVILGGVRTLPGTTVADRAAYLREQADGLRRLLTRPPYGDLSQSINLVVPPAAPDADVGLVIMGTMGYPNFSGSNALCTMAALTDSGRLDLSGGHREVALETPGGVTTLSLHGQHGRLQEVAYDALPGHEVGRGRAEVPGYGSVDYSIIDGGAVYLVVDAEQIGMAADRTPPDRVAAFFDPLLAAVAARSPTAKLGSPGRPSLGLLAGAPRRDAGRTAVTIAVYMDGGVICQGPTGTGTTALLSWLLLRGQIGTGSTLQVSSPFGHTFGATLTGSDIVAGTPRVRTRISGHPEVIGRSELVLPDDHPALAGDRLFGPGAGSAGDRRR